MLRLALTATVLAASASFASSVAASASSLAECLEASDFIANAARSRDNGLSREAFMQRLAGDLDAIRNFPSTLRWFAHDESDARFLTRSAARVFDDPVDPETHRSIFLRACFARVDEDAGEPV
ncbi:MAG TPA: hypothetical protein VMV45_11135 [Casimicrobiaceae bacterium]|nr:hypothetical protein [Casimicrobiaceae bacterium]